MESQHQKNSKETARIKILIILISLVIVVFIVYAARTQQTTLDVNSYLENKYHQEFRILEEKSRQCETSSMIIDGTVFWRSKKIKDKYEYSYDVLSLSDQVKFKVYQLSNHGKNQFEDSYEVIKQTNIALEEFANDIINTIGNENTSFKMTISEPTDYALFYTSDLTIEINEDLDEIFDNEYIKKLYKIQDFIEKKTAIIKKEGRMNFDIFLEFLNNKTIRLGDYGPSVNEFKESNDLLTRADLEKMNVSLEDYQNNINNE